MTPLYNLTLYQEKADLRMETVPDVDREEHHGTWIQKKYPSVYLSLDERKLLSAKLLEMSSCSISLETSFDNFGWNPETKLHTVQLTCCETGETKTINTK